MGSVLNDVLKPALRKLGNFNPDPEEQADALTAYNNMVSNISVDDGILPFHTRAETHTLVVGTASYTIGSGADINTVRPEEITGAYIRDASGYDHPVDVDMTLDEYNAIWDKDRSQRPTRLLYLREHPNGRILFDSAPAAAETFTFDSLKQISELATVNTTLTIPPEYKDMFVFNLAVRLAPDYGHELDKPTMDIAEKTWRRIVGQNVKKLMSPVAMDKALRNIAGRRYDINTDT